MLGKTSISETGSLGQQSAARSDSSTVALALVPPAYGIEFADRHRAEPVEPRHSTPVGVVQRMEKAGSDDKKQDGPKQDDEDEEDDGRIALQLGNRPLAGLLGVGAKVTAGADEAQRYANVIGEAEAALDESGDITQGFVGALSNALRGRLTEVRLQTPDDDAEFIGGYNPRERTIDIGIASEVLAAAVEQQGTGTAGENLLGTILHEFTHAFDMGVIGNRIYRRQARDRLAAALPLQGSQNQLEARISAIKDTVGLIDPHVDHTIMQSILEGNHESLLTEIIANVAEASAANDPVAVLLRNEHLQQRDNESEQAYQQRVTQGWDRLMASVITPYMAGLTHDDTVPKPIRDYFVNAMLLKIPTSGAELWAEIAERRARAQQAILAFLQNANVADEDDDENDGQDSKDSKDSKENAKN